jgi:hypothetical protein
MKKSAIAKPGKIIPASGTKIEGKYEAVIISFLKF